MPTRKSNRLKVQPLAQDAADELMKSLARLFDKFEEAFSTEKERRIGREQLWALPLDARQYFTVSINGIPYLLIGINMKPLPDKSDTIAISSFARIVPVPKGLAPNCMRHFIGKTLADFCRENGKRYITARLTDDGLKVFEKLQAEPPRGVSITIKDKSCCMEVRYPRSTGR